MKNDKLILHLLRLLFLICYVATFYYVSKDIQSKDIKLLVYAIFFSSIMILGHLNAIKDTQEREFDILFNRILDINTKLYELTNIKLKILELKNILNKKS